MLQSVHKGDSVGRLSCTAKSRDKVARVFLAKVSVVNNATLKQFLVTCFILAHNGSCQE